MEAKVSCTSKVPLARAVFPLIEGRCYPRSVTLKPSETPQVAGEDGPVSEQHLITSLVMCLASMLTEKGLSFLEFWLFCQMEPGSNGSQCREGSWDAAAEVLAHLGTVHSNKRFWCMQVDAASATGGYVYVSARVCGHKLFAFFLILNLRNDLLKTTFIYLSSLRSRTIIKGMKSRTVFHFSDPELDKFPPLPAFLIEALHRSASRPS